MRDHRLDWRDGVPVSLQFEDPFYSLADGLAETGHVFLQGNALADRLRDGFQIGELGFGTGLNVLATWALWDNLGREGRFGFTSFEAYPLSEAQVAQALEPFDVLADKRDALIALWPEILDGKSVEVGPIDLRVVIGDARQTLETTDLAIDAWFLDGFAPERNPELWGPDLLVAVGAKTTAGGTCATYSAAGHVRRGLEAAGFEVERVPGFGGKRHMTRGVKR